MRRQGYGGYGGGGGRGMGGYGGRGVGRGGRGGNSIFRMIGPLLVLAVVGFIGFKFAYPMYQDFQKDGKVDVPIIGEFDTGTVGDKFKDVIGDVTGSKGSSSSGSGTANQSSAPVGGQKAIGMLNNLQVKGKSAKTGYSRDQFGSAWTDKATGVMYANNGCDTRNDILKRDLSNVQLDKNGCTVLSGTLNDPYTGKTIQFQRGPESARVQIDHLVALGNAWVTGAQSWDVSKRTAFANDPRNLAAADGPQNGAKGDKDASGWLPPNKKARCSYVSAQVNVKYIYGLWVTPSEKDAMMNILKGCP